jgi:hypothetical protein
MMTRRSRKIISAESLPPRAATISRHAEVRAGQRGVSITRGLLVKLEALLPVLSERPQRLYTEGSTFVVSVRDGEPVIITAWKGR